MNFLEYKNNLINNNIMLFDYDYRNSYQNIICLMKEIETADFKSQSPPITNKYNPKIIPK